MADELPYDTYPNLLLRCTCGAQTAIRWTGERYAADDPTWRYHSDPDDDMKSRLWHCGQDGHTSMIAGIKAREGFRLYRG